MTELVLAPTTALATPMVTSEQYEVIRKTIAKDATPEEIQLYLYDCQRQGVHPLDRLLHFTKRAGKYVPITSIDLMRARAADTGEHAGSDDPIFQGTPGDDDFTAAVTVYRLVSGRRCGFTASARWSEYKPAPGSNGQGDVMWKKMPHLMLGKCAEALALRKAFPRQLAGTYTKEEMARADQEPIPRPAPPPQPSRRTRMLAKIEALAHEAETLDLDVVLLKPLEQMSDSELEGHGKRLREAIDMEQTTRVVDVAL